MGLRELVEFVGAKITAAPFGQRESQLQTAFFHQKRQVAVYQLLLQGDGGTGNNQPFVARLRHDAARQQIGKRFAHAGRPFDDGDALALALGRFFAFGAGFAAGKGVGHRRNHLALGGAGAELRQVFGNGAVMVADGVFF